MGDIWCGLCNGYGDHDSAHHISQLVGGDRVRVRYDGRDYDARVEEARGKRVRVAFPLSRGRTHTLWVDVDAVTRLT